MANQEFNTPQAALVHYGKLGMRWGVRNDTRSPAPSVGGRGVTVRQDGSISVEAGASLQRLVRSSGKSLPMKDITYASLTEYDNARYVKTIAGKGIFGGGRDQILALTATKKIEAPSVTEATRITASLIVKDPKFKKSLEDGASFSGKMTDKEFKQIQKDPTGDVAKTWYELANTSLTFDEGFAPGIKYAQTAFRNELQTKGYNAVRDENDFRGGIAKAPIVIFSPEKSLRVTSVTNITDEFRTANKQQLKQYKSRGKDWLERELYDA